MPMTDEQLQASADFYGIDMAEARRRHEVCLAQGDNPEDPICIGCARRPHELMSVLTAMVTSEEELADITVEEAREYVLTGEGTLNRMNGHFLCDECYIRNGCPSNDRGWTCP